ncbi:hypothetical protein L2E82_22941 [Cichorium intybus]|uniref:Uncharacterized protein n=1 Tax=Cichorium intybus TaxID=13427 RepID=A0ACB9DZG6_CICIN|nr:hypothetical protein L2E82_22941 [Cichorium intybus]
MEDPTPFKGTIIENQNEATKSIHLDGEEIKEATVLLTEKLVGELRMLNTSPRGVHYEEPSPEKLHNRMVGSLSPKYDRSQSSPNPSPELNQLNTPNGLLQDNFPEKAQDVNSEEEITYKTPPKELSADDTLANTQFENKEEQILANSLNRTEFSGKLKKLLSTNLSIAEKLEGEDKANVIYNKDLAGMEKYAQTQHTKKKNNQHQFEQRITRSQLRLMEENTKLRTRPNFSNTYSGNSSMSITVAQRLEEVGTICGMKKAKLGNKHFNNCGRKGASIGNQ